MDAARIVQMWRSGLHCIFVIIKFKFIWRLHAPELNLLSPYRFDFNCNHRWSESEIVLIKQGIIRMRRRFDGLTRCYAGTVFGFDFFAKWFTFFTTVSLIIISRLFCLRIDSKNFYLFFFNHTRVIYRVFWGIQ